jgi:hypothetical protein
MDGTQTPIAISPVEGGAGKTRKPAADQGAAGRIEPRGFAGATVMITGGRCYLGCLLI